MFHGNVSADIAIGLTKVRALIADAKIPPSKLDESINIATWNIRAFGMKKRKQAAIHYIAEIIGQFDLVSIVELRDNLSDLARVLEILGPYWKCVYSDMIPDAGGNRERLAFVYDERAVQFTGLAAEVSPPRKKKGFEYVSEGSFWRAPYMASFQSGNFDFVVLVSHIRWGDSVPARAAELARLADWIEAKRLEKSKEDKDLIVMGDFNIDDNTGVLFKAMTKHGLRIPTALQQQEFGTNLQKDKRYDQILHHPIYSDNFSKKGGILDFFVDESTIPILFAGGMTKEDYTYQMSDHLPLWMQVNVDIDQHQLDAIIQKRKPA